MRSRGTRLLGLLLATALSWTAFGNMLESLEKRIYEAFLDGDYNTAVKLIEEHLRFTPHDVVMLYNAACAHGRLGNVDRSATFLRKAVAAGLVDLDQILSDPDLASIREHPTYLTVVERLRQEPSNRGDAMDRWRSLYGKDHYRYERDADRRIAFATALDPTSHREMVTMIEQQADQLKRTLFPTNLAEYLLVAVPTPGDSRRLFKNDTTGGIYEHERRRLIARDIGASLRHELTHAYHYADMDRLGQRHPLWVQEGIATLYESYVIEPDGGILFLANERHNVVKGMAKAGRLPRWSDLFRASDDAFMADAGRHYPQVRSIFEFLADEGKLECWYTALTETLARDPSGSLAFRECFHMPLEDVERAWRRWIVSRPTVDLSIRVGEAALGIETTFRGSNDGVLITRILPGSAAARSALEVGDIIVAANGRPTRTLTELKAVIASKHVGESVLVRARRQREYFTVPVSLRPLRPDGW